ncbi:uncharacterized protein ACO6RY_01433 [Pungitius sinensis]
MPRRQKAHYVAYERAHLALSPEGPLVTRSSSKTRATHPSAPEEGNKKMTHTSTGSEDEGVLQPPGVLEALRVCVCC